MRRYFVITPRRAGGGAVRTLVVGSATLAILLVCFAMYQYTQVDAPGLPEPRRPRIAAPDDPPPDVPPSGDAGGEVGVPVGRGVIGAGRDVKLTIYAPEGTEPRFDIEVADWKPRPGAIDEFFLMRPRIRMRTRSGNAVRVTADEGVIEARRRGGGSLDPQRGRLTGHVVVEYDRLTEQERSRRGEGEASTIHPSEIVRIEMPEIEFDIEYAKVVVPGTVQVHAADVELSAGQVEVRFNEAQNRVESLRIAQGGRLVLRGLPGDGETMIPGSGGAVRREMTVAQWLRETLRTRLVRTDSSPVAKAPEAKNANVQGQKQKGDEPEVRREDIQETDVFGGFAVSRRKDGAYVFRSIGDAAQPKSEAPVRYHARFEREIDVSRTAGERMISRLEADWLEVFRDISRQDAVGVRTRQSAGGQRGVNDESTPPDVQEEIVVAWRGRLAVEALDADAEEEQREGRTKISAGGAPVRLVHSDGDIVCAELNYSPAEAKMELIGSEDYPVRVHSINEGALTGTRLVARQEGDRFALTVAGPGTVFRNPSSEVGGPPETQPNSVRSAETAEEPAERDAGALRISFDSELRAVGRLVNVRRWDLRQLRVGEEKQHRIDEATLTGAVRLTHRDVRMESDVLTVNFADARRSFSSSRASLQRLRGVGRVSLVQGDDRITCDTLEVLMGDDPRGGIRPRKATARGDVSAVQGRRSIRANEMVSVEFGVRDVLDDENDSGDGDTGKAFDAGLRRSSRVTPRTLHAVGDVAVLDPGARLNVRAETLTCNFTMHGDIESATVRGTAQRPASVGLEDLTVAGATVSLDVRDERVEVPGPGRLTILSMKDLDGRTLREPRNIAVDLGAFASLSWEREPGVV